MDVATENKAMYTQDSESGGWSALRLLVLAVLTLSAFAPIYPSLVRTWLNHSDNSHGILVPFIVAYLLWDRRAEINAIPARTSWTGFWVLAASLAVYLVSYAGDTAVLSRLMIVCSLSGLALFTAGPRRMYVMAFPLAFAFFMVPVPDSLLLMVAFPLQTFATKVSAALIQALSIPVYREGNMLYFAATQLEVAEACSGIRSIMSYLMLSTLMAYIFRRKGLVRGMILVASAVPLAIFANIVRVTGTGILASYFGAVVARGFLHEFSGMVVFIFGLVCLVGEWKFIDWYSARRRRRVQP